MKKLNILLHVLYLTLCHRLLVCIMTYQNIILSCFYFFTSQCSISLRISSGRALFSLPSRRYTWHFFGIRPLLPQLGWFSTAVRDSNRECSVVARRFGPYVDCKCSRLVCGQYVRLGYMAVFVLIPRIAFFIIHTRWKLRIFSRTRNSNASSSGLEEEEWE